MAKVPKTSGQGVSRKSYQTGYRLEHPGSSSTASSFKPLSAPQGAGTASGARSYGKSGFAAPKGQPYTSEPAPDLVPFGVSNLKMAQGFMKGEKPSKKLKGF